MNFLHRSGPKQAWTASPSQEAEIQYLGGVDSTSPLAPAYLEFAGVTNLNVRQRYIVLIAASRLSEHCYLFDIHR